MPKIISSVIIVVLLVLGIWFLWLPQYQKHNLLKAQINERKTELQNKDKYFEELKDISRKLKNYEAPLAKIDSIFKRPQLTDMYNFMVKEPGQYGLLLKSLSISEGQLSSEKETGMFVISLDLSLSGSYAAFKNFISAMQKNIRLFEVESLNFSSPGAEGIFNFFVKMKTRSY